MPDHVHALLRLKEPATLSRFIQQWKRMSSIRLKEFLKEHLPAYAATTDWNEPIWQAGFYDFNVFSDRKAREKLKGLSVNKPLRDCAGF
jgi:REP element-mobilizing transposase RayT